jgi:heat shock protein HslJ
MKLLYFFIGLFLLSSCGNGSEANETNESAADTTAVEAVTEQETVEEEAPKNYQFPEIEGKEWKLLSYEYDGTLRKPSDGDIPYMTLEEGKIYGLGGCNNFNGTVSLQSDGTISVGELASTKKICQNRMTQEKTFLDLLQGAQTYSVNKVFLEVASENGKLSFRTAYRADQ